MEQHASSNDLRTGPWTEEEDSILINLININGPGSWNSIACNSGLRRSASSCRNRWAYYLEPYIRRENITDKEMLEILQRHYEYGNNWSKIVQHLPGRTDHEIKNFWNFRIQMAAKQLNCDVNSEEFVETMKTILTKRMKATATEGAGGTGGGSAATAVPASSTANCRLNVTN